METAEIRAADTGKLCTYVINDSAGSPAPRYDLRWGCRDAVRCPNDGAFEGAL